MSAINADGLALGGNYIGKSADKAPLVEWKNMPTAVLGRRALEECTTIADVERLLRASPPTERCAAVACDRDGGAVLEMTPKTLVARRDGGVCFGTNHFRSKELSVAETNWRAEVLAKAAGAERLGVADVARVMHDVNQGAWTAPTMVFDAKALTLHVAFGDGKTSASERPLKEVDLAALLKP